jgi:hypothetical protein
MPEKGKCGPAANPHFLQLLECLACDEFFGFVLSHSSRASPTRRYAAYVITVTTGAFDAFLLSRNPWSRRALRLRVGDCICVGAVLLLYGVSHLLRFGITRRFAVFGLDVRMEDVSDLHESSRFRRLGSSQTIPLFRFTAPRSANDPFTIVNVSSSGG